MTMVDESLLRQALQEAASQLDPPPEGPERLQVAARGGMAEMEAARDPDRADPADMGPGDHQVPRLAPSGHRRAYRVATIAACLLVLVTGVGVAVARLGGNGASSESPGLPARGGSGVANGPELGSGATSGSGAKSAGAHGSAAPSPATKGSSGQAAKVVETGTLSLLIGHGSLNPVMNTLSALATGDGGYVASSNTSGGSGGASGSITLRIPDASFTTVLARAKTLGSVQALRTQAKDVTSQVANLQAQISALQASRQQYLTILSKATTIGAILSVQSQINSIQSQTQQLQGQLNVLNSETTYASLAVTLQERSGGGSPVPQTSGVVRAWDGSLHGFMAGVNGLISIIGPLLFLILLLGAALFLGRLLWRAVDRRRL